MAKSALRPVRRCFGSLAAALGLICALSSGSARAQATDDPEELLKAALTEFKAGRWNEAYALFERLHREEPSARTLRGMGLSANESSRYSAAITDLKAALLEARRQHDGAHRK